MKSKKGSSSIGDGTTCCGSCYFTPAQKCLFYTAVVLPIAAIVAFALVLVVNAATLQTKFVRTVFGPDDLPTLADQDEALAQAARFAQAVSIATVSYNATNREEAAFERMHRYIRDTYPSVHSSGKHSLSILLIKMSLNILLSDSF